MDKIRVLVVDDGAVMRHMISDALANDPALEVAGTASNGRIALAKIAKLRPDLVTLDIEMPEMNGLETLSELRPLYPALPVIMFSRQTQRGAAATVEALALGASDYVNKPVSSDGISGALQRLRDELIPKIKLVCDRSRNNKTLHAAANKTQSGRSLHGAVPPRVPAAARVEVLVIGVSTGGPNALAQLLPQLSPAFPVPIVIVQHMPPVFTRLLAERLSSQTRTLISEGRPGQVLTPGGGWIAPGDYHMEIVRAEGHPRLQLHQDMPQNSARPSVDVLFRSAANTFGAGVLGVVLTGMGQDGLRGCERIRDAGGQVLVQDEASSVVWGMPGAVARAGLAHKILPLQDLAAEIVRRVHVGRDKPAPVPTAGGY